MQVLKIYKVTARTLLNLSYIAVYGELGFTLAFQENFGKVTCTVAKLVGFYVVYGACT